MYNHRYLSQRASIVRPKAQSPRPHRTYDQNFSNEDFSRACFCSVSPCFSLSLHCASLFLLAVVFTACCAGSSFRGEVHSRPLHCKESNSCSAVLREEEATCEVVSLCCDADDNDGTEVLVPAMVRERRSCQKNLKKEEKCVWTLSGQGEIESSF